MGSEQNWNSADDSASFQCSEPTLCAKGCGFFGSATTMNLCSKCYRDLRMEEERSASAMAAFESSLNPKNLIAAEDREEKKAFDFSAAVVEAARRSDPACEAATSAESGGDRPPVKVSSRCASCNKRVGLMGFVCKCESTYCGAHRYPEKHECAFDFKGAGKDVIAKANPMIKAEKLQKI